MNRLQKKCLLGATLLLLHALPLLIFMVGTAFFNKPDPISEAHIIEIIPSAIVTDGATGGGNPVAASRAAEPATQAAPAPAPQPEPVQRAPEPEPTPRPQPRVEIPKPTPVVKEAPVIPETKRVVKTPVKPQPKPVADKPKVDLGKLVVRDTSQKRKESEKLAQETAEREDRAAQKAHEQRMAAFSKTVGSIRKNLSGATTIETGSGGSGGGVAEMNYADLVLSKYDAAWFAPADVDDNEAIVKARVVIARSGKVISADIIKSSRNGTLDKSVDRALDLKFIAPFPVGSSDSQRTYIINFNLKTKRGIG